MEKPETGSINTENAKPIKTPVWRKNLCCLSYQWSFWVCVRNKEYSFTYYYNQSLGIQVQISTSNNTHSTFNDNLPQYNFLLTLFCYTYYASTLT